MKGTVLEVLPNARFRCRTEDGREVVCHVAGEGRMRLVRLLPGEAVTIEVSPLDPGKARILAKAGAAGRQES